ncbi:hypothetical protein [Paludisphaera mucosa]|uniref:HEPN AbiU2-like domain-containing protein n=1 Tax=Paludisphaera mucosa TaxID=3030827 RepID=A0ABT6F720_9BACT|nr:hypothetical protein [Paludisphaera mucosa]MDG3003281.1 hypothetical protein [Paludisphaera mucosa]
MDKPDEVSPDEKPRFDTRASVRERYYALNEQIRQLRELMFILRQTYGDPSTLELWRRLAPYSMVLLQRFLYKQLILSACTICDVAWWNEKKGIANCTLAQLADAIGKDGEEELKLEFHRKLTLIEDVRERIFTARHKSIAHNDYETIVGRVQTPKIFVEDVNEFVKQARIMLEDVRSAYGFGPTFPPPEMSFEGEHQGSPLEPVDGGLVQLITLLKRIEGGHPVEWPKSPPMFLIEDPGV